MSWQLPHASYLCLSRTSHLALLAVGFYLAYDTHLAISFMVGLFPYMRSPTR
jgi:hypothetical protein